MHRADDCYSTSHNPRADRGASIMQAHQQSTSWGGRRICGCENCIGGQARLPSWPQNQLQPNAYVTAALLYQIVLANHVCGKQPGRLCSPLVAMHPRAAAISSLLQVVWGFKQLIPGRRQSRAGRGKRHYRHWADCSAPWRWPIYACRLADTCTSVVLRLAGCSSCTPAEDICGVACIARHLEPCPPAATSAESSAWGTSESAHCCYTLLANMAH
jgi:hypothetical protein